MPLRSNPWLIIGPAWLVILALCAPAQAQDRENCLFCHQFQGLSRFDPETDRVHLFYVDPSYTGHLKGAHARLACTDCHNADEVKTVPHQPTTPVDCARQCHIRGADNAPIRFSHDNIVDMLSASVHTPDALGDLQFTGGVLLQTGQSKCLYCHDEPVYNGAGPVAAKISQLGERAFDRCDVCHKTQLPIDTRFFVSHVASRLAPARTTLAMAQTCAMCHSDPAIVAAHDGMQDAVASYMRSFHGKAALLGDTDTAGCVDCHVRSGANAHLMLGPARDESAVAPDHLGDTCSNIRCHPGADPAIAATAVHLDLAISGGTLEFAIAVAFIILTILAFGPTFLITVLELLHMALGRADNHHGPRYRMTERLMDDRRGRRLLIRMTPAQRMQHWLLVLLFVMLVLTGFPLKFPEHAWSGAVVSAIGGTGITRIVHRWSGVALVVGFGLHMLNVLGRVARRARQRKPDGSIVGFGGAVMELPMMPNFADLRKSGELLSYLLLRRKERPAFGRFTIAEKMDYIGVAWGTTLLGLTGFIMWGEQIVSHWLGGRVFNIAQIIHTYEAFLAVIHVGILHLCAVIFSPLVFPLSPAALSGRTPTAKLAEEHGEFVAGVAEKLNLPPEGATNA
ncbi:MAG: cytochrome b/b6 domain-containing protein [Phycisphaerales bacterium]|nr:cytochrome b/b6 domain-containing protein [Phycisphaerales bacterium]